nr:MAG TPA: hypothetical protein [Caudoviricetes sp.]DAX12546.1 MAG TPA: hypothetical protein [Bacteriophage sp.]
MFFKFSRIFSFMFFRSIWFRINHHIRNKKMGRRLSPAGPIPTRK